MNYARHAKRPFTWFIKVNLKYEWYPADGRLGNATAEDVDTYDKDCEIVSRPTSPIQLSQNSNSGNELSRSVIRLEIETAVKHTELIIMNNKTN